MSCSENKIAFKCLPSGVFKADRKAYLSENVSEVYACILKLGCRISSDS
jgi:hypothetical protein